MKLNKADLANACILKLHALIGARASAMGQFCQCLIGKLSKQRHPQFGKNGLDAVLDAILRLNRSNVGSADFVTFEIEKGFVISDTICSIERTLLD